MEVADHECKHSSFTFTWTELFKKTPDGKALSGGLKIPELHKAASKWIKGTQETPEEAGGASSAIGDIEVALTSATDQGCNADEEQMRKKTVAKYEEFLGKLVTFQVMDEVNFDPPTLIALWKKIKRPEKKKKLVAGSPDKLFLACVELFPQHSGVHGEETFRGIPQQLSTEFKNLMQWLASTKTENDIVGIADGRSEVVRNEVRQIMKTAFGDETMELWITYSMETSLKSDLRNPKRKLAWSCDNMEKIFAAPPTAGVGGTRRRLVPRDHYTKSGESTNFCKSYTGVDWRHLCEIPRCSSAKKVEILGQSAVGDFVKARVQKEIKEKGHPLFWGEWKPVHYYSTLMRDFECSEVVDWTPGSGAACIAALYHGVPYTAFFQNAAHKDFVWNYIKRVFLAIVVEKKEKVVDADLAASVCRYLEQSADSARQLLPRTEPLKVVESQTGDNDSNDDDE